MPELNIKANYNNRIINIRIKENKQGGDEKIIFFTKNMTFSPLPRVISRKRF